MITKFAEIKFSPFVDGYCDVENQIPEYLLCKAKSLFLKEDSEKLGITDLEHLEERRKRICEYFLRAIGGLPEERTSLNPKVKGLIEREKYRVEKVIYESLPKFYVASLLYTPKGCKDKTPGILFVCGHAKQAKAYPLYQKICIDLVKNGFTVLAIDPPGQGEMLQYWDPKEKREIIRWGTVEHSYAGLQCILIGDNIARYFIWNGIRGIDYLISRKEVDEERIGVTGNSGGGTQTAYLMMVEPRVKVAVPCSYITSLNMLLKTIGPQDAEQNIFGAIKVGLNHDDFLAAFAPKPVLIGVSAYDFFPIEGTLQTLRRTKRIYSLYNAEENVAICVGKHAHMYSDELREAAINWFKVHLKGEPPNFRVKPVTVELEESLRATKSGQVIEEYPDAKTIYNLNVEHYLEKRPLRLKVENEKDLERYLGRLRLELADLLDIKKRKETIYPRIYSTIKFDGYAVEKIFFFSEPGITLTSMMFYKDDVGDEAPPVLALFEDGTNDIAEKSEFIKRILDKGKKILVLDVRGTGGVKVRRVSPYDESYGFKWSKGTEFKLSYTCFLLGSSLLGMRVFDVLRCIDYLKLRRDLNFDELQIYGEGRAALYGFFAAILHPEVKHITLKNMLYSYENLLKTRIYSRRYGEDMMVYGILKHFDIVDLLPSLHKRDYKFVNLRNAKDEIVTVEDLERDWLQVIEKYYPLLGDIRNRVVTEEKDY